MPSMGGGAADGLQQVLARLYLEANQTQQRQDHEQQTARQRQLDAENTRRWDAEQSMRRETLDRTLAQDRTKADQDTAASTARTAALDAVLTDPTIPEPTKRLLSLGQHGLGANLNVHAFEGPDAHSAHVAAEAKTAGDQKFSEWQRQADYTEGLRAKRPIAGRLVKDDPAFPAGVQSHLAQIRSRHGDFEGALGELINSLPQHQQAHPSLQPQKAVAALQAMYAGGGRPAAPDGGDGLVSSALAGGARASSSGRGAGSGAGSDASAKAVSVAELQALAQRRGTTVEQERARATAAGYSVR